MMRLESSELPFRGGGNVRCGKPCLAWARLAGLFVLGAALAWAGLPAHAQSPDEESMYAAAARAFQDGFYERAERQLAEFTRQFPESDRLPEAILLQARAALRREQVEEARRLLAEAIGRAGPLADQYTYWMGQVLLRAQDYRAAADAFSSMPAAFPDSNWLLDAAYGEALARFRMRDYTAVTRLLADAEGLFQAAQQTRTNSDLAVRGRLLLAEAYLELGRFGEANQVIANRVEADADLSLEYRWRGQYVACRIDLAAGKLEEALAGTTNLMSLAAAAGQGKFLAESIFVRARILEHLERLDEALAALDEALRDSVPADSRRRALLRSIELTLDAGRTEEAGQKLEAFFARYPEDAARDVGLLTYGELQLKQALRDPASRLSERPPALGATETNALRAAFNYFERLTTNYPNSDLAGQAWLNRGWCLWLEGRVAESRAAFAKATELAPFSKYKAVAILKLADAHYFLNELTEAARQYRALLETFVEVSEVRTELFDYALYQLTRVHLDLGQVEAADEAMDQLVKEHGQSPFADRAMLLVAQALSQAGKSAASREILADCLRRYADRPLAPEVELALARTYVEDQNWTEALSQYNRWISQHPTNALLPRAEFNLAWSTYRSGQDTNAFYRFTNFLNRYPGHELAPQARLWLGDYYLARQDDLKAQANYQDTNLLSSSLSYLARMMAGRAAFAGGRWKDAGDHFLFLINDNDCPPSIAVEAYFGFGDTIVRQVNEGEKALQKFEDAIVVFNKIPQLYPDDARVPQAWGRIGQCYFTMAESEPRHYDNATNAFHRVLSHPDADVAARSQAEIGLGFAIERMARLRSEPARAQMARQALDHYLNVVYGTRPALGEGQNPDPFWLKEAGLAAGKLAEELKDWETAEKLYQRLITMLPPLRSVLVKRLERVREQMAVARS